MTSKSAIFIGGEGRAGTRLLRSIIGKIPAIYEIPRETYIFVNDNRIAGSLFDQLEQSKDKKGLLLLVLLVIFYRKEIAQRKFKVLKGNYDQALKIWAEHKFASKHDHDKKVFSLFQNIQGSITSIDRYVIFDFVLDCLCEEGNCARWVEKTPANIYHTDNIFKKYPNAKFISIIRNPFAVYASWKKKNKKKSILTVIIAWKRVVKKVLHLRTVMKSERFLSIRYEDLVSDPELAVKDLCDFLEEPYSDNLLKVEVINTTEANRGQKGFDKTSLDKWKSQLNFVEKAIISLFTAKYRKYFNY